MSTAVLELPRARERGETRPSLRRLSAVELRKMVDTRAGFWVLLALLGVTVTTLVVTLATARYGNADDPTFKDLFQLAALPSAMLLPIVGILLVSSEWTQRTTLLTFTLVPRRARVLAAKALAGVVLASAAVVIALGLGALSTAIAQPHVSGAWSLSPELIGQGALYVTASMLLGVGFGVMLLSSPLAIVLYFGMPIGLSAVAAIPWFDGIAPWLDWWTSIAVLLDEPLDGTEWAHAGTTLAVWLVLPLLVGLWRITRSEVN
jgi:ABC-2 type transport system permease protein